MCFFNDHSFVRKEPIEMKRDQIHDFIDQQMRGVKCNFMRSRILLKKQQQITKQMLNKKI